MDDDIFETNIRNEIRDWSKTFLEKPNKNYNNFPACPFAAKAWADNRVDIQFSYDNSPLEFYQILSNYDDRFELVILIDLGYDSNSDRFHEYLSGINETIAQNCFGDRDLFVMGFHPEDESNELLNNEETIETQTFETESEEMYSMIFIQRLSLLCEASNKLQKKRYYDRKFGNYEVSNILENRNNLFKRMIKCQN
mgnify:CR=1 FL=1|tara:strand:+ start:5262 stop:5849 length:588 start_codon:yes stop_codon:yes gene_type:complete